MHRDLYVLLEVFFMRGQKPDLLETLVKREDWYGVLEGPGYPAANLQFASQSRGDTVAVCLITRLP